MPSAVEVKWKPKLSIPINPNSADLSALLADNIKSALGDSEGVAILDYVDGSAIQTFLVHYPVFKDIETGGFQDSLSKANDLSPTLDKMDQNFDIGDLSDFANMEIEPIEAVLKHDDLFKEIQGRIEAGFTETNTLWISPFYIVGGGATVENGLGFGGDKISLTVIFEKVEFAEGVIKAIIAIDEPDSGTSALSGAKITFKNIALIDIGGNEIPADQDVVTLTDLNRSETLEFNLENQVLEGNFQIRIGSYTDNSSSAGAVKLSIKPSAMEDLKFRSISGLKIDPSYRVDIASQSIPLDLDDDNYFVHAIIGSGTIDFDIGNSQDDNPSEFLNFTLSPHLSLSQAGYFYNGASYSGLDKDDDGVSLDLQEVNPNDLEIKSSSYLTLESDHAYFEFSDTDLEKGETTLLIKPELKIERFDLVHIDVNNQLGGLSPEIKPILLTDAAKYISSIVYDEIGVQLDCGEVRLPGGLKMQIMVKEENLGINHPGGAVYKDVEEGASITFTSAPATETEVILKGPGAVEYLEFEVDIKLLGAEDTEITLNDSGPKVIALKNLSPNDKAAFKVELNPSLINKWSRMTIDASEIDAFDGEFPTDGDGINLSLMNDFLNGFIIEGIEAKLYIHGPTAFFALGPDINVEMVYTSNEVDVSKNLVLRPLDSGDAAAQFKPDEYEGEYTASDLPLNGIDLDLANLFTDLPSGLRFKYSISWGKITVQNNKEYDFDEPLGVEILLKFPLKLKAGPGGAKIAFPDMFKDKPDLFDREKPDDSSMLDWINSLRLNITMNKSVFDGGKLYMKDSNNALYEGIVFPLSGTSLGLDIKGNDLAYINKTIPYLPEIGLEFGPDAEIKIPRGLGALRLDFDADINYKIKLNELREGAEE
jgi:hypothetical protein